MKKISIYFLLFCMGLMAASCVEPLTPQPVLPGGSYEISLSTICLSPKTKADEPEYPILVPGVDTLNENKISHIDYFVYKNGQTDPVEHGRVSQDSVVIPMADYVGTATSIDGFVYVIANLPEDQYRHTKTDGFQKKVDGTWSTIAALDTASLKNLEVVASFNALLNGKFKKQDNFVMSGDVKYSLTTTAPKAKVTAELDRLASKITLDLSVVPAIDELQTLPNGDVIYVQTWYPVLEDIDIYLSYADNHATLRGTPEYYTTNFFTYNREGFRPKYSYTSTTDTTNTVPGVTPDWDDENWKWSVSGLASPFYTYPIEWKTEDNTAPFIKIILPWAPYDEKAGLHYVADPIVDENGNLIYYDDEGNPYQKMVGGRTKRTRKGPDQEFYYKIALPSKTKDESTGRLQLLNNDWYNLVLEVAILGGTSDDLPLEVAGQYYVVDWNAPSFTAGGSLAQGRYLDVARDTFYIYGCDSIVIPVSSSHNLDPNLTRITSAQRWNARTSAWQTINRGSVEVNGRSSVTFTNNLVTAMGSTLDCYMMKFDVTISQPVPTEAGQVRKEKQITIIQYPAIYVDSKPGGNVMIDGYYGNVNNYYQAYSTGGDQTPTLNAFQTNTTTYQIGQGSQATVSFSNGFAFESGTRMSTPQNPNSGTITVTAPAGGTITRINIAYRNNYAASNAVWTPTGTTGTTTRWDGSASQVSVDLSRSNGSNRLTVSSVQVYFTSGGGPGGSGVSGTSTSSIADTPYAPISRFVNTQQSMTVITISSLGNNSQYTIPTNGNIRNDLPGSPGQYSYLLSDPREDAGYTSADLEPYFNGTGTEAWGDDAAKIKVGSTTTPNFIAPKFMISSRWGRMGNWQPQNENPPLTNQQRFEIVQKRCATYQEAGYPAGRWRLPTEAEIMFIANLQEYDFIDDLFTSTGYSISAYGSVFAVGNADLYNAFQGKSCRCIYDLWYWGDEPDPEALSNGTYSKYLVKP